MISSFFLPGKWVLGPDCVGEALPDEMMEVFCIVVSPQGQRCCHVPPRPASRLFFPCLAEASLCSSPLVHCLCHNFDVAHNDVCFPSCVGICRNALCRIILCREVRSGPGTERALRGGIWRVMACFGAFIPPPHTPSTPPYPLHPPPYPPYPENQKVNKPLPI